MGPRGDIVMSVAMTEQDARPERFYSRPWFRPLLGVLIVAAILLAAPLWGRYNADGKIDPAVSRDAEVVNVIVDLPFEVSTFHRVELSTFGVFSGRDRNNPGDRTRVRLQNVRQEDLVRMANLFWVEKIEPA